MEALIFLLGIIFGSFANVIIFRLNTGESLVRGGSRCFSCAKNLRWYELMPVFSFAWLRGKCARCRSKISLQYPLVELGTGILFLLLFWELKEFGVWDFGIGGSLEIRNWLKPDGLAHVGELEILYSAILPFFYIATIYIAWFFLFVASIYDLRHMILPDTLLGIAFGGALGGALVENGLSIEFLYFIAGAAGAFLFFFIFWYASKGRWMGLGDAKFALVLGMLMPASHLFVSLFLSFLIGGVVGAYFLIIKKSSAKTQIPFGQFLFLGGLLGFLWGDKILQWYMNVLGGAIL